MKELIRKTSQNGRYGVVIVGPDGTKFPAEGKLFSLGKIEGHKTFEFSPEQTGEWVVVGSDLEPIQGCATIVAQDLQGGQGVAVMVCGEFAAMRSYGYKRRQENIHCLHNGQWVNVPASVLAAMGVIPCEREEVKSDIPELSGTLAAALKAAGIK